jgi:hypothetical protein
VAQHHSKKSDSEIANGSEVVALVRSSIDAALVKPPALIASCSTISQERTLPPVTRSNSRGREEGQQEGEINKITRVIARARREEREQQQNREQEIDTDTGTGGDLQR